MANLNDIPAPLQVLIQNKKRPLIEACLYPELSFRQVAEPEALGIRIGESLTRFRGNLIAPSTSPLTPGQFNSGLDNGMTPKTRQVEAYTLSPKLYGDTMDLHKFNNITALVGEYLQNLKAQSQQAPASIDILARNVLMQAYLSGNSWANLSSGGSSTSFSVDDVTGFETVMVNGVPTAVSGATPLAVTINGVAASVTGVSVDATSTAFKSYSARSGVLTLAVARSTSVGDKIISVDAPRIVKPWVSGSERANLLDIALGDRLTMKQLRLGRAYLRNQGVQMLEGAFNVYLTADVMDQLFDDADFKQAFQGTGTTEVYGDGQVARMLDLRFIISHQHVTQAAATSSANNPTLAKTHYPIMVGNSALAEGDYAGAEDLNAEAGGQSLLLHNVDTIDGISFIERASMDRLGLTMSQSWMWAGDFMAPTDSLATPAVIPTASNSRYKRAVVLACSE
jgi:hypothetical protein